MPSAEQKKLRITYAFLFFGALWLFLMPKASFAQMNETLVLGKVFCAAGKLPLEGVNVYFEGSSVGTQTDEDGFFVLRNRGTQNRLVFSSIGYRSKQIRIEPFSIAEINIFLHEEIRLLEEVFVIPGQNPALDLLKRVRANRLQNDVFARGWMLRQSASESILLQQPHTSRPASRLFTQLKSGLVSDQDSTLFLPLYVSTENWVLMPNGNRESVSKTSKATPENFEVLFAQLTGDFAVDMNFYRNNMQLLGRNFVSPLSVSGNTFYRYFLIDSVSHPKGKEYRIRFRSRNSKNLAFNGEMRIDSATAALTFITAHLPAAANINFVNQLTVTHHFQQHAQKGFFPSTTESLVQMSYPIYADSLNNLPDLILRRKVTTTGIDSLYGLAETNVSTEISSEELSDQIARLNELPLMRTARWIADVVITGNMDLGWIDLGPVHQLMRLSNQEGLRFSLPLRTNEQLWENVSIGGYWGYGWRNKNHAYEVKAALRLPFAHKTVFSASYTNDLRRFDYDYSDYRIRENPLLSGDEDIANTLFAFRSTPYLQHRRELMLGLTFDWNHNIESRLAFRSNHYGQFPTLPLRVNNLQVDGIYHRFGSINTRFSYNERVYEDHLQRIYLPNFHPVFYVHLEAGETKVNSVPAQPYAKLTFEMKHQALLRMGTWNYSVGAGYILGQLPSQLMFLPVGSQTSLFKRFHYNLMHYGEFAFDRYFSTHHELVFNGILFNHLPVINRWNLRELITCKLLLGGLSNKSMLYDVPYQWQSMPPYYMEMGVGVANIFRLFSLQAVWRFSDTKALRRFGIITGMRIQF